MEYFVAGAALGLFIGFIAYRFARNENRPSGGSGSGGGGSNRENTHLK